MFWWETAHFDLFIVFSGTVQHWNVIEEGVRVKFRKSWPGQAA